MRASSQYDHGSNNEHEQQSDANNAKRYFAVEGAPSHEAIQQGVG